MRRPRPPIATEAPRSAVRAWARVPMNGWWRGSHRREVEPPTAWLSRTWWTAGGVILVLWALRLASAADLYPWVEAVSVPIGLWGLVVAVLAWTGNPGSARWRGIAWTTLLLALLAFGVWAYLQIAAAPGYGTDEIAFDQYAAHLVVHGLDPYRFSMAPAIARYHGSPDGWTYQLSGHPVTTLSYPALAFLLYTPLLALGWSTQAAALVNIVAWGATVAVLFAVVPRSLRPLAIVLGSLSVYVGYAVGGVTDALFVPLLVGAVAGWDRSATERGWRSWRSPILMGLALAVKQTPWFVAGFLVTALWLERRHITGSGRAAWACSGRYLAIALGVFLVPNLWFVITDPGAWLHGVLAPFSGHVVPAGQGLVSLSLALGIGGGSLLAYTAAAACVLVCLWALEVASWPKLRPVVVLLPSLVLFFATRSLGSYLVELLPVALAAAVTLRPAPARATRGTTAVATTDGRGLSAPAADIGVSALPVGAGPLGHLVRAAAARGPVGWRLAAVASGILALGAVAVALGSPSPLAMRIVAVRTTGQLATIDRVTVRVTNDSGSPQRPHFTIERGDALTTFWRAQGGPTVLGAGRRATYTLRAPNAPAMPPITGGFQVIAFTEPPDAVSRTTAYLPTRAHLVLLPQALNQPLVVGQLVTIRAELLDALDQPVHLAGVPVYLGQIIYTQTGPRAPSTTIDGAPPGETPVMALTDRQGVATFVVRATTAMANPVYFEANLVSSTNYYPYGYSPILMAYFVRGAQ